MIKTNERVLSVVLAVAFVLSMVTAIMPTTVLAATLSEGNYTYTVEDGKATIISYFGGDSEFIIIPSTIGGYPVTTIGDGVQTVFSNNKTRGVVIFPDSVTKISKQAIYDYNVTYAFSIPNSVTAISDGATSSIAIATIYSTDGSEAQRYAKQIGSGFNSSAVNLSVTTGKGGSISNSGKYLIPKTLEKKYNLTYTIKADKGYKINDLQVNGVSVSEAKSKNSYDLIYTLEANNSKDISITADFVVDENAKNSAEEDKSTNETTKTGSDEVSDSGASVGKYANTMGVCGGEYYSTVVDGKTIIYKLVKTYGTVNASEKFKSKSEVIAYAEKQGLKYGTDYDYIHLYNYYDKTDTNKSEYPNGKAYYVAYLYKQYTGSLLDLSANISNLTDATSEDTSKRVYNTSGVFAQNKSEITLKNFTTKSYSNFYGPTEGGNFYGGNSAILSDSGATINLVNPIVEGLANSAFATYKGIINITGGRFFASFTGSHGPYVAYGGKIYLNTTSETEEPAVSARPSAGLASITRNKETNAVEVTDKTGENVTAIITADEASTALATDTGGGTIVANNVLSKSYGLRSAGVYSIGSNEGLAYVYNSNLISYLDAGLVSASGGYIYTNNSIIQGVVGIKTRAGQNSSNKSEVRVKNSYVSAYYDKDEMAKAYDISTPEDVANSNIISKAKKDFFELNMFVDKANQWSYNEAALKYWFGDGYSTAPGYSGGNNIAVIYTDGSKTPIYVESTKLENKNYSKYKDAEGSKAKNLIISSEGNGTANVHFINENSKTKWDLTGESDDTTKIVGDFNVAEASASSGMGMPGGAAPNMDQSSGNGAANADQSNGTGVQNNDQSSDTGAPNMGQSNGQGTNSSAGSNAQAMPSGSGAPSMPGSSGSSQAGNYLNAYFENSEWEGTVVGVSKNTNLTFDGSSSWKVTDDTTIDTLTVAAGTVITSDKPVTINCSKVVVTGDGIFTAGDNVTIKY